jgi:hypothetical protein
VAEQVALTIIAPVRSEAVQPLKVALTIMGRDPAGNVVLPFGRLPNVHYARFVLLDPTMDLDGQPIPPRLVYMSDADGSLEHHLRDIVALAGERLDLVYAYCEGYPSRGARTRESRLAYLRAHRVDAITSYVNTRGLTAEQIRRDARLRDAIQEFLDTSRRDWSGATPEQVRAEIQQFVASHESLRWALQPPRPDVPMLVRDALHLAGGILLALLLAVPAAVALPVVAVLLRYHELRDPAPRIHPSPERIQELAALEDHTPQNQFSAIGFVKPGWFRLFLGTTVLRIASFVVRHRYARADLAGVKTIHFARWVFLDEQQRLFFASNYDGSLENYMDDFIDKVAWGLNASFSNGVGYPRTNWLVLDGAKDEGAFKDFIRTHQLPTHFWYAAYPHLTAANIAQNARLRQNLPGSLSPAETEAWLRLL